MRTIWTHSGIYLISALMKSTLAMVARVTARSALATMIVMNMLEFTDIIAAAIMA